MSMGNNRRIYIERAVAGGVLAVMLCLTAYLGVAYFGFGKKFAGVLISASLLPFIVGAIATYRLWLFKPPKDS